MDNRLVYSPVGMLLMLFLAFLLFMVVGFLFLDLARTAFTKIGFSWSQALFVLLASLIGSGINIPVTDMQCSAPLVRERNVWAFGIPYRVPVMESLSCNTLLAINVGGAVIPALISIALIFQFPASLLYALAGIAFVAILTNRVAKPVQGLGIVTPALLPPLSAALAAILMVYVWGAPVASIGGAGTFDGVFLSGLIAVLLV